MTILPNMTNSRYRSAAANAPRAKQLIAFQEFQHSVAERRQVHTIEGLSSGKYNLDIFWNALIHFAAACPKCHKALIRAEQYLHRP
jgi:hypothetical protein